MKIGFAPVRGRYCHHPLHFQDAPDEHVDQHHRIFQPHRPAGRRFFAGTTKGSQRYDKMNYQRGDVLVFGPETRGLPAEVLAEFAPEFRIRLPMHPDNRSLNLSNAVAITVYEAWRQNDFAGGL